MMMRVLGLLLLAGTLAAQDHAQHDQPGEEETPTPIRGSGTSWLPASSPMEMWHFSSGDWNFMLMGFANFAYQDESEPRGTSEWFSTNMAMFSAGRGVGSGDFNFRFMASLEPTLGRAGYPLLFQTGETADGVNPLFDRQHPHDLLMEIGFRYDIPHRTIGLVVLLLRACRRSSHWTDRVHAPVRGRRQSSGTALASLARRHSHQLRSADVRMDPRRESEARRLRSSTAPSPTPTVGTSTRSSSIRSRLASPSTRRRASRSKAALDFSKGPNNSTPIRIC